MPRLGPLLHLATLAEQEDALEHLDLPIDDLERFAPLTPSDATHLRDVASYLRVQTLRALVLHPDADSWLAVRAGEADAKRIGRALADWLEAGIARELDDDEELNDGGLRHDSPLRHDGPPRHDSRPAPRTAVAALPALPALPAPGQPPRALAALRAWADRYGVADWLVLSVPALPPYFRTAIAPILGQHAASITLEELVTGNDLHLRIGLAPSARRVAEQIAQPALRLLEDVARVVASDRDRRQRLDARARPPSEPALRALQERLEAARAAVALRAPPRLPGAYHVVAASTALEPCRFVYEEQQTFASYAFRVELALETDPLATSCSCGQDACQHALAALGAALDLLRDPDEPARAQLADAVCTPPWERVFRLFDHEVARRAKPPPEAQRLAWRIVPTSETTILFDPLLQKRTKAGKWSQGQRLNAAALAQRPELCTDPADAEVLALISEAAWNPSIAGMNARYAKALEALLGHERVVFATPRGDTPARIERARLRVALEPSDGGLRIALSLVPLSAARAGAGAGAGETAAYPLDARRLQAFTGGDDHAFAIDPERALVLLFRTEAKLRALVGALARQPAIFPAESHDELLRRLSMLQEQADVALPPELLGAQIDADPRALVRFTPIAGAGVDVDLLTRPAEGGPVFAPGAGPATVLHALRGRRVSVRRDLAAEVVRATELRGALPLGGAEERGPWQLRLGGEESVLDLVTALRERAAAQGDVVVEWPAERPEVVGTARIGALRVRIAEGRDWFGLEGDVDVDGQRIPLLALLDAVRQGRRYIALGPRRFAAIQAELHRRLAAVADVAYRGRHGLEIGPAAAPAITELVDEPGQLEAVTTWRTLLRRLDAARALDPAVPATLGATLRPYQVEGFRWLCRLAAWGMGACLADDMGLGKTVQTLAFLLHRAAEGPALVVAPTSVGPNWIQEAERFAKSLRARLYRGSAREAILGELRPGDLVVTSYALAARDAEALREAGFATLVLDEAQAVKNALTRRARAIRSLGVPMTVALTGTPVENHLGELWSVMRLVAPGLLGSFEQFRERFAAPIERHRDPARRAALARAVRPFLLRRTKAEVAPELPPRVEVQRFVDLSAGERRLYDAARLAAIEALAAGGSGPEARFAILAAITRLRRLACHPRLVDEATTVSSSKLAAFMELARELREEDHRALVFSQFTTHLALVREALDGERIAYEYLDGATPAEERARRVAAFQAGSTDLFLISVKAGGTGLNLTAADHVIHLDPWWNPAVEDQATDRAHRIGQTKSVTVIRLIARATIEEAVVGLHGDKRALAAGVFDEEGGVGRLSARELAELVRAGEGAVAEADALAETEAEAAAADADAPAEAEMGAGADAPAEADAPAVADPVNRSRRARDEPPGRSPRPPGASAAARPRSRRNAP